MAVHQKATCLVGVAQETVRPADGPAPEPLESWERVAVAAARDAGVSRDLLRDLDSLQVVFTQSWAYDDPVGLLAARLRATPRHSVYSGVGGTTPQRLVSETAEAIARGDLDTALIVGAEALATRRALKRAGDRPSWSHPHPNGFRYPPHRYPDPSQQQHGATMPALTFPLAETARRAGLGMAPVDYLAGIGRLCASMTEVAAKNPHAWFPTAATVEELVTVSADNRLVGSPYPKRTIAILDVDKAAALLVMSEAAADRFGVASDRRVYLHSSAFADETDTVAARPQIGASPAMAAASHAALTAAGVGIDEIRHLDLYSCFTSAVHLACDALGISATDPRGVTVTGGLPYAGGPGSDYVLHSIAAMVETLRADTGALGLISGLSLHLSGHSYAVYSTRPAMPAIIAATAVVPDPVDVASSYSGPASVAAYSVAHDRAGEPEYAVVVCTLPDGRRAYARTDESALLADALSRELVGEHVDITTDGTSNAARW